MARTGKVRFVFASAIALLVVCGIATYTTFFYFQTSERWVSHTQEVRGVMGDLEAALSRAGRARMTYLILGEDSALSDYRASVSQLPGLVRRLRELASDNPIQVANSAELDSVIGQRLAMWEDSIARKQQGQTIDLPEMVRQNLSLTGQSEAISTKIRMEETRLLESRRQIAHQRFVLASAMVVASFGFALLLLSVYHRSLKRQLQAREEAEQTARLAYEREAALRPQEERFRLFIDAVKDYAIITLDAKGHVSSWNQGAERLKGYTASEILGKHYSKFHPAEEVQAGKPQRELEIATREGRVEDEGWRVRKDGSRFWANVLMSAIRDQSGQLIGFAKVTRDFTERMRVHSALQRSNVELAAEISERTTAEQRLAASEQSLRELSLRLLSTQDEERRRIGRELHDSLGQYLAMLKLNLDSMSSAAPGGSNGSAQQLAECIRLAEEAIREMRTISYLLYPPMLEELGLKSAIPWYLEGFSKRSNIRTSFEADPDLGRLSREKELALFRVLQESLTNVHRHSGSSDASIRLSAADGTVVLEIRDTGKGIPSGLLEQSGEDWMGSLGWDYAGWTSACGSSEASWRFPPLQVGRSYEPSCQSDKRQHWWNRHRPSFLRIRLIRAALREHMQPTRRTLSAFPSPDTLSSCNVLSGASSR